MRIALILLGFLAVAVLACRLLHKERAWVDEAPLTPWILFRTLFVPLLGGVVFLVMTVRALIGGEVACSAKGGGCKVDTFVRAEHPQAYWVNLGFFALMSAFLLWVAWRGYRRWREASRRA